MKKNDPRDLRYSACENFIHLASLSDKIDNIAIIKFSASAKTVMPWTHTRSIEEKEAAKVLSRNRTGNFTNINEALELSSNMFEDSYANEKVLVLLTDGKNVPGRYRDTHELLMEQGVRVYTVGLSKQADSETLRNIAAETGGEHFDAVDDKKLMQVYNQIAQELNDFKLIQQGVSDGKLSFPMTKYDEFVDINVFDYPKDSEFILVDAQKNSIPLKRIRGSSKENTSIMRVPNPLPGWYTLTLKSKQPGATFNYDLNTNSKLFLKLFPLEKKYIKGEVVHFAASMAHRQTPMIKSEIRARVTDVKDVVVMDMVLFDDGVHGDNHADDGVYCSIQPIDLPEGDYQIEFIAKGKTPDGEDFLRVENETFTVLEAGGDVQDYFLASVLPLYIDFGRVEQGSDAKANLRLSFEGRSARKITMFPGDDIVPNQGDGRGIKWESFEFPKEIELNPSQPVVLSLKINLPQKTIPGGYNGSVIVQLGNQQLMIPLDLEVKLTSMTKQLVKKSEQILAPRTLDTEPKRLKGPKSLEPLAMRGEFDPQKEKLAIPKAKKAVEFDQKPKPTPPPKPVVEKVIEVKKTIQFSVTPENLTPFQVEMGQYASCLFQIKNESDFSGNVQLRLDGFGEIDRDVIELKKGESYDLTWFWDIEELPSAEQPIRLTVFNEGGEVVRKLHWNIKQAEIPLIFYITCVALLIIAVVYGIAYIVSSKPRHGFVSMSAFTHLAIVIISFFYILPEREKQEEETDVFVVDLITDPEVVEQPVEEKVVDQAQPEQQSVQKVNPTQPQEKPRPRAVQIQRQEATVLRRSQTEVKPRVSQVQEVELKPVEREPTTEDRVFEKLERPKDSRPVVMSINDRPQRRAVLAPKKVQPVQKEMNVRRSEEGIFRERRVTSSLANEAPEAIQLKSTVQQKSPDALNEPDQQFEAGEKPEMKTEVSQMDLKEQIKKIEEAKSSANVQKAQNLELAQRAAELEASKASVAIEKTKAAPSDKVKLAEGQRSQPNALIAEIPITEVATAKLEAGVMDLRETIEKVQVDKTETKKAQAQAIEEVNRKVVQADLERSRAVSKTTPAQVMTKPQIQLQSNLKANAGQYDRLKAFNPKESASANLKITKLKQSMDLNIQDAPTAKIELDKSQDPANAKKPEAAAVKLEQRTVQPEISKSKSTKPAVSSSQLIRKDSPQSLKLSKLKRRSSNQSELVKKGRRTSSSGKLLPEPKPLKLQEIEADKKTLTPKLDDSEKGPE
jgi:hypothetical protein